MWLCEPAMLHWYYSQPSLYVGLTTAATMPGGGCPSGLVVPSSAGGSVFVHQRAVPCRSPGVGSFPPCGWFRGYPWFVVRVDDSCTYRHIDSTCTCSMYIHYLHTCMGTCEKMYMSVPETAFTSTGMASDCTLVGNQPGWQAWQPSAIVIELTANPWAADHLPQQKRSEHNKWLGQEYAMTNKNG